MVAAASQTSSYGDGLLNIFVMIMDTASPNAIGQAANSLSLVALPWTSRFLLTARLSRSLRLFQNSNTTSLVVLRMTTGSKHNNVEHE